MNDTAFSNCAVHLQLGKKFLALFQAFINIIHHQEHLMLNIIFL